MQLAPNSTFWLKDVMDVMFLSKGSWSFTGLIGWKKVIVDCCLYLYIKLCLLQLDPNISMSRVDMTLPSFTKVTAHILPGVAYILALLLSSANYRIVLSSELIW